MFASLLGAWLGLATLAGAASNPDSAGKLSRFEFVETHMGSSFKVLLYSTDATTARRASRLAFDRIAALDATLSDYQPESELSRLSLKAGGPAVAVSADLFDILERSKQFHARTEGVFDVTIAPVGRLWRRARRDHKLPDPQKLAEARALVGSDKLLLDSKNRTVQLTRPGMRLDVGGIAKGYASQAAIDVLRTQGITPRTGRWRRRHRGRRPAAGRGRLDHCHRRIEPLGRRRRGIHPAGERGDLDLRRRRAVRDHRRPSLLPHHQPGHRNGRRGPRQRHRGRPRRRHCRRAWKPPSICSARSGD